MQRNLSALAQQPFDVLVVGGGIYGACAVYEAVSRGLSAALIEKSDFGGATSANGLKIIHGGLRYLQQADLVRMRESITERRTLLRIAPHLVHPMPVMVPIYGHGMKGKEFMTLALLANDMVSADRNRLSDPEKHISNGHVISRDECLNRLPRIPTAGLTGAAVFCDAQVYNSERLPLAFIRSAEQRGAVVANYVEATSFCMMGERVNGVQARDTLSGQTFEIHAQTVITVAGPWTDRLLSTIPGASPIRTQDKTDTRWAKAINVITRPLFEHYAVGLSSRPAQRDASRPHSSRLYFIAPWRGYSIIGTAYFPCAEHPDSFEVRAEEIGELLAEINSAYPQAQLTAADVRLTHKGLLPMQGSNPQTGDVRLHKHYSIIDERHGGYAGLIQVVGVKYTTARNVAQKTIDRVFQLAGQTPSPSPTARTPLYGGDIERFDDTLAAVQRRYTDIYTPAHMRSLLCNYGTAYNEVLEYAPTPGAHAVTQDDALLEAQVYYGVREEMAQRLSDVVFRRTELGSAGFPGLEPIQQCARLMAQELGWSETHTQNELQDTLSRFGLRDNAPVASTFTSPRMAKHEGNNGTKATELAHSAVQ
jgi:glycerol-3-phosphate dehydrogenase